MAHPVPSTTRKVLPEAPKELPPEVPARQPVETVVVVYRQRGCEIRTRNGVVEVDLDGGEFNAESVRQMLLSFARRDTELAIEMVGKLIPVGTAPPYFDDTED